LKRHGLIAVIAGCYTNCSCAWMHEQERRGTTSVEVHPSDVYARPEDGWTQVAHPVLARSLPLIEAEHGREIAVAELRTDLASQETMWFLYDSNLRIVVTRAEQDLCPD
jgi:hypothetical protein